MEKFQKQQLEQLVNHAEYLYDILLIGSHEDDRAPYWSIAKEEAKALKNVQFANA